MTLQYEIRVGFSRNANMKRESIASEKRFTYWSSTRNRKGISSVLHKSADGGTFLTFRPEKPRDISQLFVSTTETSTFVNRDGEKKSEKNGSRIRRLLWCYLAFDTARLRQQRGGLQVKSLKAKETLRTQCFIQIKK